MPTSRECVCCAEIDEVAEKMQEGPHKVTCITHWIIVHIVHNDW